MYALCIALSCDDRPDCVLQALVQLLLQLRIEALHAHFVLNETQDHVFVLLLHASCVLRANLPNELGDVEAAITHRIVKCGAVGATETHSDLDAVL